MPRVLDYQEMIDSLQAKAIKPLYYNSGTFGFIDEKATRFVGWIAGDDATLRAEFQEHAVHVDVTKMPSLVRRLWNAGPLWFTPGSHWAYEIHDGGTDYIPQLLRAFDVNPDELGKSNRGNAIEFQLNEADRLEEFLAQLLTRQRITDYGLVLPEQRIIGLLHHHQQIWWRMLDSAQEELLKQLPCSCKE